MFAVCRPLAGVTCLLRPTPEVRWNSLLSWNVYAIFALPVYSVKSVRYGANCAAYARKIAVMKSEFICFAKCAQMLMVAVTSPCVTSCDTPAPAYSLLP
ncbi:hypothetical protein KCP73_23970 [Salmonella enterica subsp. enterica]|nr:hypothetical protein KCP73_23970 [Salmonella enterica subsp. enterica]